MGAEGAGGGGLGGGGGDGGGEDGRGSGAGRQPTFGDDEDALTSPRLGICGVLA